MDRLSLQALFGKESSIINDKNFQLILIVAIIIPTGNGLLSPILDSLIGPFDATATNIGLMVSVFWAPGILIVPISGILADRLGRKIVLVYSLLIYGLAGSAIVLTTNFQIVLILRFFQGIGWAGLLPLVVTTIGDSYTGAKETTAQGLRMTVSALVGGLISLLAGVLVLIRWEYPFLIIAFAIPVAVLVYVWLDEPTAGTVENNDKKTIFYLHDMYDLIRQPSIFFLVTARFLPVIVWVGFFTYNSIITIRLMQGTTVQAGVLFLLVSVMTAIAASQTGRLKALFNTEYWLLVGANISLAIGFAIVAFAPTFLFGSIGTILIGIGNGITMPLYRSLITGIAPESLRSGLVSIGATGGRLMGTVTPIVMGGVIASLTPLLGFTGAVQATVLSTGIVSGGGGIICVTLASGVLSESVVPIKSADSHN
jgi:MFS family permease